MTVVFTTIFGGSDSLKPAPVGADRCICLVDDLALFPDAKGWELVPVAIATGADPRRLAWRMRCLPDTVFNTYDRAIWIDASFTLTDLPRLLKDAGDAPIAAIRHHGRHSPYDEGAQLVKNGQARQQDITAQVASYRADGYQPFHLSISCIVVRDRSRIAREFNQTWASQIDRHLGDNTQVSLDYSAWKAGTEIKALQGTRHENPYSTHDHSDHKKRRRPYRVPA